MPAVDNAGFPKVSFVSSYYDETLNTLHGPDARASLRARPARHRAGRR